MMTTTLALVAFFVHEGWTIEINEDGRTLAVQGSGYGSGPSVIDLDALAEHIEKASK
jgi:hypothetical protein